MPMKYSGGRGFNVLARCVAAPTMAPAADANYPAAGAADNQPARPVRYGSIAADCKITYDLNEAVNPSADVDLSSWIEENTGTGDVTRTTTAGEYSTAPGAFKFVSGTGTAKLRQDLFVRAGERRRAMVALKSNGVNAMKAYIQDLLTGHWLKSDGTWQAGQVAWASQAGAGYLTFTVDFATKAFSQAGDWWIPIRLILLDDTAGTTMFADDYVTFALLSGAAIIGHNLEGQLALEFRGDDAAFAGAGTLIGTFGLVKPSAYLAFAEQTYRYVRFVWSGTPYAQQWAGELWAGAWATAGVYPDRQVNWTLLQPQTRHRSPQGGTWVDNRTGHPHHEPLEIPIRARSEAALQELLQDIMLRTEYGAQPLLLVPTDLRSEVLFCRVESAVPVRPLSVWSDGLFASVLPVVEEPFPRLVA